MCKAIDVRHCAPDVICAQLVPQMCTLSLLCKKSASPFERLLDALRGEGGGERVQKVALPYYTLQTAASITLLAASILRQRRTNSDGESFLFAPLQFHLTHFKKSSEH